MPQSKLDFKKRKKKKSRDKRRKKKGSPERKPRKKSDLPKKRLKRKQDWPKKLVLRKKKQRRLLPMPSKLKKSKTRGKRPNCKSNKSYREKRRSKNGLFLQKRRLLRKLSPRYLSSMIGIKMVVSTLMRPKPSSWNAVKKMRIRRFKNHILEKCLINSIQMIMELLRKTSLEVSLEA